MNVLISAKGRALLTDFGHSRLTNSSFSMTADPPLGGTLNWLAPENVDTGECNSPGDIWAFGMTALVCFQYFTICRFNSFSFRNYFPGQIPFMTYEVYRLF